MAIGILYLFLIFTVCFIFIHLLKLAFLGFKSARKKPEPPPKPKAEPKPKPKPEPEQVYFIVEKKKTKKTTYSEPKEIKFKK